MLRSKSITRGDISPALILPSLVCSLAEKRRSTDCLKEEEGFQPCHLQKDCRGHLTALFPPLALERAAPAVCFTCCHGINRTARLFCLASLSHHSGGRTGVFALTVYRGTIPTEGRVPGWPRAKHGARDTLEPLLLLSLLSGVLRSAPICSDLLRSALLCSNLLRSASLRSAPPHSVYTELGVFACARPAVFQQRYSQPARANLTP